MWDYDPLEREFHILSTCFFEDIFDDWPITMSFMPQKDYSNPNGIFWTQEHENFRSFRNHHIKEPYIDEVLDKENNMLKLIAEMPGVEKSQINITIKDKKVLIQAYNKNRGYQTKIPLKYDIDESSAKAKYTNGILEIAFKLASNQKRNSIPIQ